MPKLVQQTRSVIICKNVQHQMNVQSPEPRGKGPIHKHMSVHKALSCYVRSSMHPYPPSSTLLARSLKEVAFEKMSKLVRGYKNRQECRVREAAFSLTNVPCPSSSGSSSWEAAQHPRTLHPHPPPSCQPPAWSAAPSAARPLLTFC